MKVKTHLFPWKMCLFCYQLWSNFELYFTLLFTKNTCKWQINKGEENRQQIN